MTLLFQSELAYLVNDGAESLRLLNLLSDEPTSDSILFQGKDYQYYSNAASVYMLQGKYHLACLFSQRAVEEVRKKSQVDKNYQNNRDGFGIADGVGGEDIEKDDENSEEIYRSVSPFDKAQSEAVSYSGSLPYRCTAEVLYNAALALLLTGNFLGALSYFEQITKQLGTRPILWIRMAECCIQQYSKQNGVSQSKEGRMLVCEGSTGRGRRLQFRSDLNLGPGSSSQSNLESGTIRSRASAVSDTESGDDSLATSGYDSKINGSAKSSSNSDCKALLMNKAVQYLSNALYLIRDTRKKNETVRSTRNGHNDDNDPSNSNCTSNDNGIGNPKEFKDPPQFPVHSPTLNSLSSRTSNQKRLDELECTALSKLAYVHLELDSPLSALAAAKQIASFRSTHISELTR